MGRPKKFDRSEVIEAALAVARRDGLGQLTARSVAKELGGSTSVIYSRFESIEALRQSMVEHVVSGGTPRLIAGVQAQGLRVVVKALCMLGQREPWLFEVMTLQGRAHPAWWQSRKALSMVLAGLERFAHLDDSERLALVSRITPAAVGLAVEAAAGELTDIDAGYEAVVEPVVAHVLATRPSDDLLAGTAQS